MREFKFRAWDKLSREMYIGGDLSLTLEGELLGWKFDPKNEDRYELMQCTGLEDKNGKEVYEGDIINIVCLEYPHNNSREIVEWSDLSGDIEVRMIGLWVGWYEKLIHDYIEVVGNIYENPELIKPLEKDSLDNTGLVGTIFEDSSKEKGFID